MASSNMVAEMNTSGAVVMGVEKQSSLVFKYGTIGKILPLELKERRAR